MRRKAAPEAHRLMDVLRQVRHPALPVAIQKSGTAVVERFRLRIVTLHRLQPDLQPDELGAVDVAVILQPVGEDQANLVVLGAAQIASRKAVSLVLGVILVSQGGVTGSADSNPRTEAFSQGGQGGRHLWGISAQIEVV